MEYSVTRTGRNLTVTSFSGKEYTVIQYANGDFGISTSVNMIDPRTAYSAYPVTRTVSRPVSSNGKIGRSIVEAARAAITKARGNS